MNQKVIINRYIPFKGFTAINLFGIIFVREDRRCMSDNLYLLNHEYIHTKQMKELFYIFFYLIYIIEFLFLLIKYRNKKQAYRNISFEREAFSFEQDLDYPIFKRKRFAQWRKTNV